jgi:hypothetical protein
MVMNTCIMLWHVDLLLGNGREISNHTTAVTKQRPVNSNKGTVFFVWCVPRCYKAGQVRRVELIGELASQRTDRAQSLWAVAIRSW